jgi:hypothetical protein
MNLELRVPIKLDKNRFMGIDLLLIKSFWSTILCIVGFLLTVLMFVLPKIIEIGQVRQEIETTSIQATNTKQQTAYLAAVDQEKLRKNQTLIEEALPSTKDLYFIMNVLGEIGRNWNFSIDSFTVSPGKVSGDDGKKTITAVTKVPLDVIMVGPKDKYLDMVKQIENSLPILSVDKFDVTYLDNNLVSLKIIVGTYSNLQVEKVAAGANWSEVQLTANENALLEKLSTFSTIDVGSSGQLGLSSQNTGSRIDPFNY